MLANNSQNPEKIQTYPKYLGFLTLTYTMVIVLANWFDPRLINIFGLNTDAGTIIFPLTFLLSDLITEVYGYKHARRAIWCGFLFNIVFIIYGQAVIHMPNPGYQTHNLEFDSILTINSRIIFASILSYFCSEPLNSIIMAKLKVKLNGKYIGIRFVLSTIVASGMDSAIFSLFAFYNAMSKANLISLILTMWVIKVFIEIICLPISIRLADKLKSKEHLDIYDSHTKFNILSLNIDYNLNDNLYAQEKE
ncbi:MAG: queuosine precursor transporter [Coxiellaceae bacterium]|nr:queuosine precursor transporter [Coxiellaceae bacterium]